MTQSQAWFLFFAEIAVTVMFVAAFGVVAVTENVNAAMFFIYPAVVLNLVQAIVRFRLHRAKIDTSRNTLVAAVGLDPVSGNRIRWGLAAAFLLSVAAMFVRYYLG